MALADIQATAVETIERSKEESRRIVDNYFDFLQKAISSIPTGGTQFGEKLKSYSQTNVETARDYMRKVSRAKDFREVLRIQGDFARAQFNAFNAQAFDLSEAYTKRPIDSLDTPFKKIA